jgi:hypothetical protein
VSLLYVGSGAEIIGDVRPLMDVAKSAGGILLLGINFALPLSYYLKGLDLLLVRNPDAKLLIASDDMEFVELGSELKFSALTIRS